MKKLNILLADDHQMIREGLALLIIDQPDMQVAGQAADGQEALQLARELRPDLVVMDLSMPKLNGLQATQRLKQELPAIKILVLTVHEDESYLRQLTLAKADGYVLKRSAGDVLLEAIRRIAAGGTHFDPTLASKALLNRWAAPRVASPGHAYKLSDREKEVLLRIAWGYANKEVADQLGVSVKTVETYKARITEKLGLRSRIDAVKYALREGWMDESKGALPE